MLSYDEIKENYEELFKTYPISESASIDDKTNAFYKTFSYVSFNDEDRKIKVTTTNSNSESTIEKEYMPEEFFTIYQYSLMLFAEKYKPDSLYLLYKPSFVDEDTSVYYTSDYKIYVNIDYKNNPENITVDLKRISDNVNKTVNIVMAEVFDEN